MPRIKKTTVPESTESTIKAVDDQPNTQSSNLVEFPGTGARDTSEIDAFLAGYGIQLGGH